jgi:K+/H+ antiporter YhaU regulatory subunit KhtT
VLERTGPKVIAVEREREREVLVEFGSDFELRTDDVLFICGSIKSLERYQLSFEATTVSK